MKQIKPRICKCGCKASFLPSRPLQVAASWECAVKIGRELAIIAERKADKAGRKAHQAALLDIKPLSYWKAKAQTAVNAYIRERDRDEPCISCGRWHDGQYQAGHYLSVGAHPELRFDPENIHKQCAPCNNHKSGNIADYRPRLVGKIGLDRVEWLEGPHPAAKYTRDQLQTIIIEYRLKAKSLL